MNVDVIVYDNSGPAGAFGKRLNASKPTGGTEIHCVQLCEGLANGDGGIMLGVKGISAIQEAEYGDDRAFKPHADYLPHEMVERAECSGLVTIGLTRVPQHIKTDRHVVLWTHDPSHNIPHIGHLRWSRIVCVSKWQAARFPNGWDTIVIPAIIDDWIYDLPPVEKNPKKFVCVSAWWKGSMDTLVLWEKLRPPGAELHFGSPYSHPPNLREIVEKVPGCVYVDLANPKAVVEAMRDAAGVFRVSIAPETFGVSDAIAQILGCRIHVFGPNGVGALGETLAPEPGLSDNFETWRKVLSDTYGTTMLDWKSLGRLPDYRARNIIPQWIKLLGLEER